VSHAAAIEAELSNPETLSISTILKEVFSVPKKKKTEKTIYAFVQAKTLTSSRDYSLVLHLYSKNMCSG
jgi:hypothetical protein